MTDYKKTIQQLKKEGRYRKRISTENNGAIKSYNGLGMLIEQAALSFNIWNDFKPVTEGISKKLGF